MRSSSKRCVTSNHKRFISIGSILFFSFETSAPRLCRRLLVCICINIFIVKLSPQTSWSLLRQKCDPGAVQSIYFPAKDTDPEGKGVTAVTMAASCTYSKLHMSDSTDQIVQFYATRFDSAGSPSLAGDVNWALAWANGTALLEPRTNAYSQLWGRFRVGAGGGLLEWQGDLSLCLTHADGSLADGTVHNVTLTSCNQTSPAQKWTFTTDSQLVHDIPGSSNLGVLFVDSNDGFKVKTCVGLKCNEVWDAAWLQRLKNHRAIIDTLAVAA